MNSNAKEEMNPIKEKYKATIIIPAYNAETTIHRAVDSAVNQTTKGAVTKSIKTLFFLFSNEVRFKGV